MSSDNSGPEEIKFDDAYAYIHCLAEYEAKNQGWPQIKPSHMLVALLEAGTRFEPENIEWKEEKPSPHDFQRLHELFRECRMYEDYRSDMTKKVRVAIGNGPGCSGKPEDSNKYLEVVKRACEFARSYNSKTIGLSHLLSALLESEYTIWPKGFVSRDRLISELKEKIPLTQSKKVLRPVSEVVGLSHGKESWIETNMRRDLTDDAIRGRLSNFVGLEEQVKRVLEYASIGGQTSAVLLIGPAGSGKTALVEATAQYEVERAHLEKRDPKRIIQFSAVNLVAGSKYVGEFEKRIKSLLDEAEGNKNIVIFIDEFHTLVGLGRGEGMVLDATNLLKEALGEAKLQLIGATTEKEYRRFIEKDEAFVERFKIIKLQEPKENKVIEILEGRRNEKEKHYQVTITEDAVRFSVEGAHILPGHMPRKALSLLDDACQAAKESGKGEVSGTDVLEALSRRCNIQKAIIEEEFYRKGHLRNDLLVFLNKKVLGQEKAISLISLIFSSHIRKRLQGRSPCVFTFIGPTSVGKTQMAATLTDFLAREAGQCNVVDMNRYSGYEGLREIKGSPPGTVGYEDIPDWMESVQSHPYSVLLLRNLDDCTREVLDFVASVLKNGGLERSNGKTIDLRGCVIIITLDSHLYEKQGFGFSSSQAGGDTAEEEVKRILGAQYGDIGTIVPFGKIDLNIQKEILRDQIKTQIGKIGYNLMLNVTEPVLEYLAKKVWDSSTSVSMNRLITESIINPIFEQNLYITDKPLQVNLENGQINFSSNG